MRIDIDEDRESYDVCPCCHGFSYEIGRSGFSVAYRCRACGWTFIGEDHAQGEGEAEAAA